METIWIKRKPYTREKVAKDSALAVQEKKSIGSSMTKSGGVLKGITPSEERILMPLLLGIPDSDPSFLSACNNYYNNIKVKITHEGLKLDISLEKTGEPISDEKGKTNYPVNVADYILYRYCQVYNKVAKDLESCKSDDKKEFYIYSEVDTTKAENERAKKRTEAVKEYSKIAEDELVCNAVLRVLLGKSRVNGKPLHKISVPETTDLLLKQNVLSELAYKEPLAFLAVVLDKKLPKLAEVYELIDAGLIETPGNKFIFEGEELGTSPDHVVSFISAAANSKKYTVMKAKLDKINESKLVTI